MNSTRKLVVSCLLIFNYCAFSFAQCSCGGGMAGSFAEAGLNGLLLAKKSWISDVSTDSRFYNQSNSVQDHTHHEHSHNSPMENVKNVLSLSAGFRYGVSDNISIAIRQNSFNVTSNKNSYNKIGDVSLLTSFKVFGGCKLSVAGSLGIEMPLGKPLILNDELQPASGSGSWDPLAMLTLNYNFTRSYIRLSTQYKYNTYGYYGYNMGDMFVQQLLYNYSLINESNNDTLKSWRNKFILNVQAIVLNEFQGSQIQNKKVINSGSFAISSGVGFLLGYQRLRCVIGFYLPVYQVVDVEAMHLQSTGKLTLALVID